MRYFFIDGLKELDHISAPGAVIPAPGDQKLGMVLELITRNSFKKKTIRFKLSNKKFPYIKKVGFNIQL